MSDERLYTPTELEQMIFSLEGVRIFIRAERDRRLFPAYPYLRRAQGNYTVSDWFSKRVSPILGQYQADVVCGNGSIPPGQTNLDTVRNSYR